MNNDQTNNYVVAMPHTGANSTVFKYIVDIE